MTLSAVPTPSSSVGGPGNGPLQPHAKRIEALQAHLTIPVLRASIQRQGYDNAVVVVPTYTAKRRELIDTTVQSIIAQTQYAQTPKLTLVVADNGLTEAEGRDLHQRIQAMRIAQRASLDVEFVDAHPNHPRETAPSFQRTAAFARNRAVTHILNASPTDARFRGPLFCLDDDAALVGPSLPVLLRALQEGENRQAVVPRFTPSDDIRLDYSRHMTSPVDITTAVGATRDLPSQFDESNFDLSMAVAFSGDVSTKTAALAISRDLLECMFKANNMLFKVYPHGSFEDMSFGSVASRLGKIAHNPVAECLDQARGDIDSLKAQKVQWGRDHVQALHDYSALGRLYAGITVLEPSYLRDHPVWVQWHIPSTKQGVIINPSQLHNGVLPTLARQIREGQYAHLGPDFAESKMLSHLQTARALVSEVMNTRPLGVKVRGDLGKPDLSIAPQGSRFHVDVQAFQLAGNLAGMGDVNSSSDPAHLKFVLGCRQKTS